MKKFLMRLFGAAAFLAATVAVLMFVLSVNTQKEPVTDTSVATAEITDCGGAYKFWFSHLSNEEKHAYNLILESIYSMPDEIAINRIDSEMLDNVFYALMSDNPDLFFVGRKCTLRTVGSETWFSVDYLIDKSEYEQMKQELDAVCAEVEKNFTDKTDLWQTELEIHDYIIDNCIYTLADDSLASSAYGALVNGEAACEGYSKAAKLLLDAAGIENTLISGVSESEEGDSGPHMWNIVTLGENRYHLDCTWDDPVDESGEQTKTHIYFNLDDESISLTHSDFSHDFGCNSLEENYFVKTGTYFESYDRSCEKTIAEVIAEKAKEGSDAAYFLFADRESFDKAVDELLTKERIYVVLKTAKNISGLKMSTKSAGYVTDETRLIIGIVPKYD